MLWNKSYNTDAMMAVKIINATGAYEPLSTATTHIMRNAGSTWMKERNTNNTDTINVNLSIDSQNNLSYALDTYFNCVEHENEEWYNSSFGIKLAVPEWEAIVTAFTLSVIIVLTVIGNTLVILSVFIYKPLRIVQNFFIVSLALADLTVALLVLPFNVAYSILGRWEFGILMCKIWLTCDVLCCTSSILNLCAIALDRYWAITDPINYAKKRTVNRVLLLIAGVWILSLLISSPPLLGWNDWSDEFTIKTPCELNSAPGYIIYSSLGSFFIPLIIMTIVYIEIFFATRRRLRERAQCAKLNTLSLKVSIPYVETFPSSNITKNQKSQSISSICYNIICCTSNMSNCFPTSIIMQNDHNSLSSDTNIHNNDNICIPNIEQPVVIVEQRKKTRRPRIKDSIKHGKLRAKKLNNERKEKSNNMAAISGDELLLQSSVTTQEISTESASDSKGGAKEATVIDDEIKDEKITPSPLLKAIPLQKKSIGVYQFIEEKQKISLSKERRAARTLGIIMGVFVICWLPFFLMYVILPFCRTCCPTSKFKNFITWLGYINSVLNPIIYTIFNLDYRRAFKRLLGMK